VRLPVAAGIQSWRVPSNTLLFREDGIFVAVVKEGAIRLSKVQLGRDFGSEVEVVSGVNEMDRVVVNPPDSLSDETKVTLQSRPPERAASS
jgi:hypothetical protein